MAGATWTHFAPPRFPRITLAASASRVNIKTLKNKDTHIALAHHTGRRGLTFWISRPSDLNIPLLKRLRKLMGLMTHAAQPTDNARSNCTKADVMCLWMDKLFTQHANDRGRPVLGLNRALQQTRLTAV